MSRDNPNHLDPKQLTLAEAADLAGLPETHIRNWLARGLFHLDEHFTGRLLFSVLDVVRLTAIHDLTERVLLGPTVASQAAELLARHIRERAPRDAIGNALLDLQAIPSSAAFALALIDGETRVALVDPTQPGGYTDLAGPWSRAHVIVPVAALLAHVAARILGMR